MIHLRSDSATPYFRARTLHVSEAGPRSFEEDVSAHLQHGYCITTPKAFLLFRPVVAGLNCSWLIDPSYVFPPEHCNCWHVHLAAGDLSELFHYLPYPLEFLSFEKRMHLKIYDLKRFQERVSNLKKSLRCA